MPRSTSPRKTLPLLAALVLGGAFGGWRDRTAQAEGERAQVARYREFAARRDDMAYEGRREAATSLADLRTEAARKALRGLVAEERGRGGDARNLLILLSALVRAGGPAELETAIEVVEGQRNAYLVAALSRILASARDEASRAWLRGPGLRRTTPPVRAQVARALGALADPEAVVPLLAVLREEDLYVRAEALLALGETRVVEALPSMAPFLSVADPRVREVAARALGMLGTTRAVPYLVRALADPALRVVESAADALGALEATGAVEALADRLALEKGKDLRTAEALERALGRITGVTLGDDADLWRAWWRANRAKAGTPGPRPDAPQTASGARYYGFPVRSSRVVFVLDVSRSMGWNERLESAKKELIQVLEHLPASTRFDLVTFSDRADAWAGKLIPATPENLRRATRHVSRLEPLNATNSLDGLRVAFRAEDADTIFFLSDGSPTVGVVDPDEILAEVTETNRWRRVRVHAVALLRGEPPPTFASSEDPMLAASFMRRLAEEHDGEFREVR